MMHLLRTIIKWLTYVCLILAVVCLIAIPVSFWRIVTVTRTNALSQETIRCLDGFIVSNDSRGPGMTASFKLSGTQPHSWFFGFDAPLFRQAPSILYERIYWPRYLFSRYAYGFHQRIATVPLWLLAAMFSLPKTVRALLKKRQLPAGCCPTCGYDLRATPDRCPECGTVHERETS